MDVSFILSSNELYTLISLASDTTKASQQFCEDALSGAEICDLSGLIEKGLAREFGDGLELEPVLRMIAGALSKADRATYHEAAWDIRSQWVNLLCEKYPFNENHWKITPVNSKEA